MTRANLTLDDVRRAVAAPRVGRAAQDRMSPRPRPGDIFPLRQGAPGKQAAVLILLYEHAGELYFFLTRRTENVATHKGQISLPGGGQEHGEQLEQTALREAREELDLNPAQIEILGEPLTPLYIPVSGYWVTAFIGYYGLGEPTPNAAADEVFEILPTRLADLLDDSVVAEEEWELRGYKVRVPFFNLHGYKVWGATAMILSEFKVLLAKSD
ncbi:MAG: CoA pyrophosphatase [Chloroflexi bacterium]|nr:CoA pyrophosphatase [Chloroflexota bacterium]